MYYTIDFEYLRNVTSECNEWIDSLEEICKNNKIIKAIYNDVGNVTYLKAENGEYIFSQSYCMCVINSVEKRDRRVLFAGLEKNCLKEVKEEVENTESSFYYKGKPVQILKEGLTSIFVTDGVTEFLITKGDLELKKYPPKGCLILEYDLYPYYTVVKYNEIINGIWFDTQIGRYSIHSEAIKKIYPYEMYESLYSERNEREQRLNEIVKSEGKRLLSKGLYIPEDK